jgi:hypothetical protein
MKDAAKVATDLMTQQQKLEDKPVQQQIENTVNDRLAKLAEEFAKFAGAKQVEAVKTTEYKVIEDGANSSSS